MTANGRETHRTASIRRTRVEDAPTTASARASASAAASRPGTRRAELTSAIPRDKRLLTGRWRRLLGVSVITAVLAALVFTLFVSPVNTWLRQRDDIAQRQHELDVVRTANAALDVELARLHSAEGQAAVVREELGYVARGDEQWNMTLNPGTSLTVPSGWPFAQVLRILQARGVAVPLTPVGQPASVPTDSAITATVDPTQP